MKQKEEESAREKRRVDKFCLHRKVYLPSTLIQDELKLKIDLEDQYVNAAKNTLTTSVKKTV